MATATKKNAIVKGKPKVNKALLPIAMQVDKICFRQKGVRSVIPSDKLIKEWGALATIKHDRPLNTARIQKLENDLQRGLFKCANWIKVYCRATRKWYRANGQHTSNLFRRVPKRILKQLRIIVEAYEVDNLSDVAALLSRIDAKASAKSSSDIYGYYASTNSQLDGLSKSTRNTCASALRYGALQDFGWQTPIEEIAKLLVKHVDFCLWMDKLTINGKKPPNGFNAATAASAYVSYRKNKAKAKDFWTQVCTGNTAFSSPAGRLREFLISHGIGGRVGSSTKKHVTSAKMLFDVSNLMFDHYSRSVVDVPELNIKELSKKFGYTAKQNSKKVKAPVIKRNRRRRVAA